MVLVARTRAAVLVCGVLLGCASDDGGGATKAEYIEQADKLCLQLHDELNALEPPASAEEAVAFLGQAVSLADDVYANFQAIRPPEDGLHVHDALLAALRDSTAKVREAMAAAERGDGDAVNAAMDEATTIGRRADEEANAYGFAVCGSEAELAD